ncbi:MAG: D-sedoheptulose 7-phosphate isomerase [Verrucomicrobiales bacterium]|nr:D-sedoheptulose 7-phosphate isomerase [Verrucomicrobiales bacterium]
MSTSALIEQTISDHEETVKKFRDQCSGTIEKMGDAVVEALRDGKKICFFGNGGSAADSQHFAAEFVVRFTRNRAALPSIAFTTDTSIITACANDFGYDEIFARQVRGLCVKGDIVVGISTSGTSANVVKGLEAAREMGVTSFAFTGENGAKCAELADVALCVPSPVTARVQECHLIAGHLICDIGEAAFSN